LLYGLQATSVIGILSSHREEDVMPTSEKNRKKEGDYFFSALEFMQGNIFLSPGPIQSKVYR
jgi:hypothetical protein